MRRPENLRIPQKKSYESVEGLCNICRSSSRCQECMQLIGLLLPMSVRRGLNNGTDKNAESVHIQAHGKLCECHVGGGHLSPAEEGRSPPYHHVFNRHYSQQQGSMKAKFGELLVEALDCLTLTRS